MNFRCTFNSCTDWISWPSSFFCMSVFSDPRNNNLSWDLLLLHFIFFLPFVKKSHPAKCWAKQNVMTKRHAENVQNSIGNLALKNLLTLMLHIHKHTDFKMLYTSHNYWILYVYSLCCASIIIIMTKMMG